MSVILSLTSAAIIAGMSVSSLTLAGILDNRKQGKIQQGMDTIYNDGKLLAKTLSDYGCCVEQVSENDLRVQTQCGTLRYYRQDETQPFRLLLEQVEDADALLEQIRVFESEYGRNVQTYTYHHIKENLGEDMQILSETVTEDDALVLTISI